MPAWVITWVLPAVQFVIKLFGGGGPSPEAAQAKQAGAALEDSAQARAALSQEQAVAQAEVDAPKDQAALEDEMKKGEF